MDGLGDNVDNGVTEPEVGVGVGKTENSAELDIISKRENRDKSVRESELVVTPAPVTDVEKVEGADLLDSQTEQAVAPTAGLIPATDFETSDVNTEIDEQKSPSNEPGSNIGYVTNDDSGIHLSEASHFSKKQRISRSNRRKRRKRLLNYHQRLVEDRGLPPSRLQQ